LLRSYAEKGFHMNVFLDDFNFLPLDILERRQRQYRWRKYSPLVLLIVLVVAAVFWIPLLYEGQIQQEIDKSKIEQANAKIIESHFNTLKGCQNQRNELRSITKSIYSQERRIAPIIDKISTIVPPGVKITELESVSSSGIRLKFESPDPVQTSRFIVGLRNLEIFEQVNVNLTPWNNEFETELKMTYIGGHWDETNTINATGSIPQNQPAAGTGNSFANSQQTP
ncbi:MAG: hypothetical protein ACM3PP_13960, partial [Candidatus Saccharibacteria bacterium]